MKPNGVTKRKASLCSILSPLVSIEEGTEVSDSIILEGVKIGKYCRINRAIIDEKVKIENGTVIEGAPVSVITRENLGKKAHVFIEEIRKKKIAKTAYKKRRW